MSLEDNPLAYLTRKAWRYAENNRRNIVIFVVLFLLAEIVDDFLVPIMWARIMSTVESRGITNDSLGTLLWNLGAIVILSTVFWMLRGPARVIAGDCAFKVRSN